MLPGLFKLLLAPLRLYELANSNIQSFISYFFQNNLDIIEFYSDLYLQYTRRIKGNIWGSSRSENK